MCGIAGYIGREKVLPERINQTLELMYNRGPDARGYKVIKESNVNIALLHSRLAILDLDPRANQPFEKNNCYLTFNGEIYNYIELREELEKLGHSFNTTSDTEVLLNAYLEWGTDCVDRFEGMWAFAIYDANKKILFLSKDRFAEKPLYVFETGGGIYFASEVKSLAALSGKKFSVNFNQLTRYVVYGYRVLHKSDETFFENVQRFPSAQNLIVNLDLEKAWQSYWEPEVKSLSLTEDEAIEGLKERLINSMKLRLRSDVPLAFCLSGGVDSGALVSIASKLLNCNVRTFSIIDDDPRYDERENIAATVNDLGCSNEQLLIDKYESFEPLKDLIAYHDAPVATINYFVHSYLAKMIHDSGCKVVFSGIAADEILTGYYDSFLFHLADIKNSEVYPQRLEEWKTYVDPLTRNRQLKVPTQFIDNPQFRDYLHLDSDLFRSFLKNDFCEEYLEQSYCDSILKNRLLNGLLQESVPLMLHEDDLNAMKYSIENRSPFLDRELVEFSLSVPSQHYIKNGYGKYLLREALKGILNDKVRLDRHKKGFNASLYSVFDFSSSEIRDVLKQKCPLYDLFSFDKVMSMLDEKVLDNSHEKFLFTIINAKLFLELHA